jgi:predicted TIM-barrel fold metal-dependent hydrolase
MKTRLFDSHVHLTGHRGIADLFEVSRTAGIERFNIVCSPGSPERSLNCNAAAMLAKLRHPGVVYVFGGLHYNAGSPTTAEGLRQQAEELWAAGCDGMKMLEGKPSTRKRIPYRMDDPVYDAYYAFLEEREIPIVWHVADPETFWDPARVSEAAKQHGWDYSDGTFPSREQLYEELEHVLDRFPSLRVTLAHFAFLSNEPERAAAFLDRHPGVCFDITPGSEMYRNFSKCPDTWRALFTRYGDRIIFGTDNVAPRERWDESRRGMLDKVEMMRRFLETPDRFEGFCTATSRFVTGLGLDPQVLEGIYSRNFEARVGPEPRLLDGDAALRLCRRVADYARRDGGQSELLDEMTEIEAALIAGIQASG